MDKEKNHRYHIPELTSLRAFAALWVMMLHTWWICGEPSLIIAFKDLSFSAQAIFRSGGTGVDIFFTLSAFLLAMPFIAWQLKSGSKPNLGIYFIRRVLRVFPAYYVQLAILLLLAVIFGIGRNLNLRELFAHSVLWLLVGENPVMPLNGVWWTLPIEFLFYFTLPVLAYLLRPRRWMILLFGTIITTWTYRAISYRWVADLPIPVRVNLIEQLPGHLDQFVIGMLAAYAYLTARLNNRTFSTNHLNCLLVAGISGIVIMVWWLLKEVDVYWEGSFLLICWHTVISLFLALILFTSAWQTPFTQRLFAHRSLYYLGEISFGIYLWHFPILHWLLPILQNIQDTDLRLLAGLGLSLPLTILAAHMSYRWIESPCLCLAHKKASRHA